MNSVQVLTTSELCGRKFTVYGTPENPLFLAKEVAEIIGHSDVSKMIQSVDDDEKCMYTNPNNLRSGGQSAWFLTENGLYEVLMQSRKPIAKTFKKGVKTILVDVRKTGMYMEQSLLEKTLQNPDFMIQLLTEYKDMKERNQILAPKAQYTDDVLLSENCYTFTQVAKDLGLRSVHELTKELSERKIIYKQSDTWMPYADYADKGYFKTRTATYDKTDGKGSSMYFVITEKGRMWLHELLGVISFA